MVDITKEAAIQAENNQRENNKKELDKRLNVDAQAYAVRIQALKELADREAEREQQQKWVSTSTSSSTSQIYVPQQPVVTTTGAAVTSNFFIDDDLASEDEVFDVGLRTIFNGNAEAYALYSAIYKGMGGHAYVKQIAQEIATEFQQEADSEEEIESTSLATPETQPETQVDPTQNNEQNNQDASNQNEPNEPNQADQNQDQVNQDDGVGLGVQVNQNQNNSRELKAESKASRQLNRSEQKQYNPPQYRSEQEQYNIPQYRLTPPSRVFLQQNPKHLVSKADEPEFFALLEMFQILEVQADQFGLTRTPLERAAVYRIIPNVVEQALERTHSTQRAVEVVGETGGKYLNLLHGAVVRELAQELARDESRSYGDHRVSQNSQAFVHNMPVTDDYGRTIAPAPSRSRGGKGRDDRRDEYDQRSYSSPTRTSPGRG